MGPVRVGVVGCGAVSRQYLPILSTLPGIEIAGLADAHVGRARDAAAAYPGSRVLDPERLINADDVEVVVNLTSISSHVEVTAAALEAGRHVYSEKPLAQNLADATRLVNLAAERGLLLACAPDTLLGCGFQAARAALASGAIGHPMAASGVMLRHSLDIPGAYSLGTNPFFDMSPYYVSALIELLGPTRRVCGRTRMLDAAGSASGQDGDPVVMAGVLETGQSVMAGVTMAWGTGYRREIPSLTVFGAEGVLRVPNPNVFDGPAFVRRHGETDWVEVKGSRQPEGRPRNLRGLGVAVLAAAIRGHTPLRAGGDLARHVVEVIEALAASSETGRHIELTTTCTPSVPLEAAEREMLLG